MAQIYDKYRDKILDNLPSKQVEIMAKHRPGRYVLPSEVEDVEAEDPETPDPEEDEIPEPKEADNSEIDATRGAISLADEQGVDLKELYTGERINKQDVQNYLDEQH